MTSNTPIDINPEETTKKLMGQAVVSFWLKLLASGMTTASSLYLAIMVQTPGALASAAIFAIITPIYIISWNRDLSFILTCQRFLEHDTQLDSNER